MERRTLFVSALSSKFFFAAQAQASVGVLSLTESMDDKEEEEEEVDAEEVVAKTNNEREASTAA